MERDRVIKKLSFPLEQNGNLYIPVTYLDSDAPELVYLGKSDAIDDVGYPYTQGDHWYIDIWKDAKKESIKLGKVLTPEEVR